MSRLKGRVEKLENDLGPCFDLAESLKQARIKHQENPQPPQTPEEIKARAQYMRARIKGY